MSVDERIIIIGSRRRRLSIFANYAYTIVPIYLLNLTFNLHYVPQICGNRDTHRRFPRCEKESEQRFTDICRHSTTNFKLNAKRRVLQHSNSIIQTATAATAATITFSTNYTIAKYCCYCQYCSYFQLWNISGSCDFQYAMESLPY